MNSSATITIICAILITPHLNRKFAYGIVFFLGFSSFIIEMAKVFLLMK